MLSVSVVSDSAAAWTVACHALLSMGILQVRILAWAPMPSFRGSFQPNPWIGKIHFFLLSEPPGKLGEFTLVMNLVLHPNELGFQFLLQNELKTKKLIYTHKIFNTLESSMSTG